MGLWNCISFLLLLKQIATKLVSWNNTKLLSYSHTVRYSTGGERPKISFVCLKSKCWLDCVCLEVLGKNLFPCLFQLPEVACILWFVTLSFILKISSKLSSSDLYFHLLIPSLTLTLCLPFLPFKDLCTDTGFTWVILDNLPTASSFISKSPVSIYGHTSTGRSGG